MSNKTQHARVVAVCTSQQKGTGKAPCEYVRIVEGYGIDQDAHAGLDTHRQVSLLGIESIEKMKTQTRSFMPGDFAENLTTEGADLFACPVGTRLRVGKQVVLEITQIGKACHKGCAILKEAGICIMPREGVFAQVIEGGNVRAGDLLEIQGDNDIDNNPKGK